MTSAQAARVTAAIGDALNLGQPANTAESKAYVINKLKSLVRQYERRLLEATVVTPDPPDIT